ncbi:MAG TPA: chemotaxis protein CheX [Bacillota bacterium]|nr:chemotaxis protein CheX [Bacillota bacterium]
MIEQMLNPDVQAGKPFFNDDPIIKYEVSVLVGVFGDLNGQVVCGMTNETARKVISQMLFTEVQEIDQMGESAICELKNIIVGTASTNLSLKGFRCNITPPLFIMRGGDIPDFLKHIHTALAIPVHTPFGDIDINLSLQKDNIPEK